MHRVFVPLALALALAPMAAAGCGSSANGVGACKQIEEARCNRAASHCPDIQLTPPYYASGSAADACIRFYDTACLNGLEVSGQSNSDVTNCVQAISNGTCAIVETPWNSPSCTWLIPPNTPEAGAEAGAADADAGDTSDSGEEGD
jgi:hypothetical protein